MIKAVLEEEDIYTIEALVAKKGSKYLVKWENFPSDQNTWEPRSAIPPFIVKFYEQVNGIEYKLVLHTITEKVPARAFSWLKAPTSAFTFKFKTLLRHLTLMLNGP